jgi:predicted RNase H-like HicB family nuclease
VVKYDNSIIMCYESELGITAKQISDSCQSFVGEVSDLEGVIMNSLFTAVIKQDGDWWIGWIEEIPGVNCQERTREELLETLKITLQEALELSRQDAIVE